VTGAPKATRIACRRVSPGVPEGDAVVLDVPQLETLLHKTFNLGLDAGRGTGEPRALVRLRLAKALLGVVESNATAANAIAIEREISSEEIAQSEALALHAAAMNGMPDPVFHLTERAMGIITGLAAIEPDPRAGENDMLLDAALQAATGLAQLLQFRQPHDRHHCARARRSDRTAHQRRSRATQSGRRTLGILRAGETTRQPVAEVAAT
jgi:hypothetical protein